VAAAPGSRPTAGRRIVLIRAARIGKDQVDIDGWLGGSPERAAEQSDAGRNGGYW